MVIIVELKFMERDNWGGGGWWNIRCRDSAPCYIALAGKNSDGKNSDVETPAKSGHLPYARCTLADPTPQLASNVVVGKSGQAMRCISASTSGPHSHGCRMVGMRTFGLAGTMKESFM